MKKILFTSFLLLLMISSISALEMSAGDTYEFDIGTTEHAYYNITGIDSGYLTITQDGQNIIINLSKYAPNSIFTIDFYVLREKRRSSGSSGVGRIEEVPINIAKIISNCDLGAKKCVGSDLWYCENGEWKSTKCDYDCEDGICIEEEKPETNKTNNSIWIILLMLIGLILLVVFCIISFKKRYMPNGTERRIKENETKINGQES